MGRVLLMAFAALASGMAAAATNLWVYAVRSFDSDRDLAEMSNIVERASRAGYTGLVLGTGRDYAADWLAPSVLDDRSLTHRAASAGVDSWWMMYSERQARVREVVRMCADSGIEFIPLVWSIGYGSMRHAQPDCLAAEPCQTDEAVYSRPKLLELDSRFPAGKATQSTAVRLPVEPLAVYRVMGYVRTENLTSGTVDSPDCGARIVVSDAAGAERGSLSVKGPASHDWSAFDFTFLSGTNAEVSVAVGKWSDEAGVAAFRDLTVRRITCTERIVRGGRTYARRRHADRQCGACLSDPRLFEYFRKSAKVVAREFEPRHWFLSTDGIVVDCACDACRAKPFADRLANCLAAQCEAIRAVSPDATVCLWSEALEASLLLPGGLPADRVPPGVVIVCRSDRGGKAALKAFSEKGLRVMAAGFCDLRDDIETAADVRGLRAALKEVGDDRADGLVYSTWRRGEGGARGDYRFLEMFALDASATDGRPFKVLAIGDDFTASVLSQLSKAAKASGFPLDIASVAISGCTFEKHWQHAVASTNSDLTPYFFDRDVRGVRVAAGQRVNLLDTLRRDDWDAVVLQQAGASGWQEESYLPWGTNLLAFVRATVPRAKVFLQETWSFTPWDRRLEQWELTPQDMYARLHAAASAFAATNSIAVIPTGTAVDIYRRTLPVAYTENSLGGDPCGGRWGGSFGRDIDGKWVPMNMDVYHLNFDGEYLQALVWLETLSGKDARECPYASVHFKESEIESKLTKLKAAAHAACKEGE